MRVFFSLRAETGTTHPKASCARVLADELRAAHGIDERAETQCRCDAVRVSFSFVDVPLTA